MGKYILHIILLSLFAPLVALGYYDNGDLLRRAHKEDAVAMRMVGIRLIKGTHGAPTNPRLGVTWLKRAADKNDTEAMYRLGLLYMNGAHVGQDKAKAEILFAGAAASGHEKAQEKLAKLRQEATSVPEKEAAVAGEPHPASSPSQAFAAGKKVELKASSTDKLLPLVAKNIALCAQSKGIQSVAVTAFLSNGGKSNKLTTALRDKLLEAMLDAPDIDILDRQDSKLVAEETGLSFAGKEPLSPASAVLMGEVFCQPGDEYGYLTYRVFKAADTRIISTGFERIKWSSQEQHLLNGAVSRKASTSLSYIEDDEISKAMSKMLRQLRNKVGIAMVQNGGANENNTLNSRMAYSQMLAAMYEKGLELYEREFMSQAATESSLLNDVASGGDSIGAVGCLKHTRSEGDQNQFKVQISAVPGGKLLSSVNVIQKNGSALGKQVANNSENDFRDLLVDLKKEAQDVKLSYEYEVYLSDQYAWPEDLKNVDISVGMLSEDGHDMTFRLGNSTPLTNDAASLLKDFARENARRLVSSKSAETEMKRLLQGAALFGFKSKGKAYIGPWGMCMAEAFTNLQFSYCAIPHDYSIADVGDCVILPMKEFLKGKRNMLAGKVNEKYDKPGFTYNVSIEYRHGLPYKVKCVIDFSPSKDKLIKKTIAAPKP